MIEAKNVNKYYGSAKDSLHVLKEINLRVEKGEIAAILGPSGAGKSTLLHILGGLDKPSSGKVFFEGKAYAGLSEAQLARIRNTRIGFVFQFYHLLPEFNVLENVMMPVLICSSGRVTKGALEEKAKKLISEVGLSRRLEHYPNQLSGGEKQRLAIARALMNEPKLLLCDEPTGNLDSENGRQICQLLKKMNQEKDMALVMVTHNLEVASLASRVYNIKDGVLGLGNN